MHNTELVRVTAADGLRLEGALHRPGQPTPPLVLGCDAVVLLHGTGSNFYSGSLLESVAMNCVRLGTAALSVNTRGHDVINVSATSGGPRRLGAAYERVSDCRMDVAAWVEWLARAGYRRIGLVGHSLGAIKACYALAQSPIENVGCVIGVSPARLSYERFVASSKAERFRALLEEANRLIAAGQGETLMDVDFPLPYLVTAAGYIDKYGPGESYNIVRFAEQLPAPALITLGSVEMSGHVAFSGLADDLEATAAGASGRLRVEVVAGADHVYTGVRDELWSRIERWMRRLAA